MALYFTTGQAARELGTTQAHIPGLCQSGAIEAETTPGGQWRVSQSELERLKQEGLPPIPRPLPGENPRPAIAKGRQSKGVLLANPSPAAVGAADN